MTHDELLAKVSLEEADGRATSGQRAQALRAVVELHKPTNILEDVGIEGLVCTTCGWRGVELYPCPTIQAIEKELK